MASIVVAKHASDSIGQKAKAISAAFEAGMANLDAQILKIQNDRTSNEAKRAEISAAIDKIKARREELSKLSESLFGDPQFRSLFETLVLAPDKSPYQDLQAENRQLIATQKQFEATLADLAQAYENMKTNALDEQKKLILDAQARLNEVQKRYTALETVLIFFANVAVNKPKHVEFATVESLQLLGNLLTDGNLSVQYVVSQIRVLTPATVQLKMTQDWGTLRTKGGERLPSEDQFTFGTRDFSDIAENFRKNHPKTDLVYDYAYRGGTVITGVRETSDRYFFRGLDPSEAFELLSLYAGSEKVTLEFQYD